MHHASYPHKYDNPPVHVFTVPRDGALAALLVREFPDIRFDEDHQEWWLDWDESQFPEHGQKLRDFEQTHGIEIGHRYL